MQALSFLVAASLLAAPTYAQCGTPDALEDNDDCTMAVAIPGGAATGLNVEDIDRDFYTVTVNDQERIIIDVAFLTANGDVDAYLWDPLVSCDSDIVGEGAGGGPLALGFSTSDDEQLVYDNNTGFSQDLIVEVRLWSGNTVATCNDYDISSTISPLVNPCLQPDALEPNQDCATAVAVPGNAATGLNVEDIDSDFYTLTVQDQERVTINVDHLVIDGDVDAYLWDPSVICDTAITGEGIGVGELAVGFTASDNEELIYDNFTGAAQNLVLEVRIWSGSAGLCNAYDLDMSFGPGVPSPCLTPDMFEPNMDCASATPISDGSYMDLDVEEADNDYYSVTVPAGGTLDVSIFFATDDGDVDLYIWDPLINCDTNIAGNNSPDALDVGFSASDNEDVSYTNLSGADQNLIIEVDMFSAGGCNSYDMDVIGAGVTGPDFIGMQFCTASPNSTGQPGICSAFGLATVADNDVELIASQLPPGQFGIFVVGQTEVPPVPIGEGFLCLGGQIGRYQDLADIFQVDPMGEGRLVIDLGMIPQPSQFVAIQPGENWKFQAWHRDVGAMGPTSNFTSGVSIDFN